MTERGGRLMSRHDDYKWVKFRTRHSSGPSKWDYREFPMETGPDARTPEDYLGSEILWALDCDLNTMSEGWRGVDAVYEDPDAATLAKMVDEQRNTVLYETKRLKRWETKLKAMK